jgi:hypothetical protein
MDKRARFYCFFFFAYQAQLLAKAARELGNSEDEFQTDLVQNKDCI